MKHLNSISNSPVPYPYKADPANLIEFSMFPPEIVEKIFLSLPLKDILTSSLLSKKISKITFGLNLWKSLFQRDFQVNPPTENFSIKTYVDYYRYRSNLAKGVYATEDIEIENSTQTFVQNDGHSAFIDGKLYFYQRNKWFHQDEFRIMIFDFETRKSEVFIKLETPLSSIAVYEELIYCLSEDNLTITVFNFKTKMCCETIKLPIGVSSFSVVSGKAILGKSDGNIQLYNLKEFKLFTSFQVHSSKVVGLAVAGSMLASSTEGEIAVLNLKTGQILGKLILNGWQHTSLAFIEGPRLVIQICHKLESIDLKLGNVSILVEDYLIKPFIFINGKIFMVNGNSRIEIKNFKAPDTEIFKEIGLEIKKCKKKLDEAQGQPSLLNIANGYLQSPMRRFLQMPKVAKNTIYKNLIHNILKNEFNLTSKDIEQDIAKYTQARGCDKHIDEFGFKWTLEDLVQAIKNYLDEIEVDSSIVSL